MAKGERPTIVEWTIATVEGWARHEMGGAYDESSTGEKSGGGGSRVPGYVGSDWAEHMTVEAALLEFGGGDPLRAVLIHVHGKHLSVDSFQLLQDGERLEPRVFGLGFTKKKLVQLAYRRFMLFLGRRLAAKAKQQMHHAARRRELAQGVPEPSYSKASIEELKHKYPADNLAETHGSD